jgi:L-histidine N-alpha-methyltransferase
MNTSSPFFIPRPSQRANPDSIPSEQGIERAASTRHSQKKGTPLSSSTLAAPALPDSEVVLTDADLAVADEAYRGLTATPRTLSPWLFYNEAGSDLFEQITRLPEYYLTRTERAIFTTHAEEIMQAVLQAPLQNPDSILAASLNSAPTYITLAELGAGTATKTGILLKALAAAQPHVLYQPIDISPTALDEARESIEREIPGVTVASQVANYITDPFTIDRPANTRILALYIGSSIGNFSPTEAREILQNLAAQLQPGDALLLGTDLAPGNSKSVETLLAAYDDDAGVTAAFNRNILTRINRDLTANFDPNSFRHRAIWNPIDSRIEMHLESLINQAAHIPATAATPALNLHFKAGETIHTENSYKFTPPAIASLLTDSGFRPTRTFTDPNSLFAVTLATVP